MSNEDMSFGFPDPAEGARRKTGILCGLLSVWRGIFKRGDKVNTGAPRFDFSAERDDEYIAIPYFRRRDEP